MEDLYLKFPDQQTAEEVLAGYEGNVDIIGAIENAIGYHVNIRGETVDSFKDFIISPPLTPIRAWL